MLMFLLGVALTLFGAMTMAASLLEAPAAPQGAQPNVAGGAAFILIGPFPIVISSGSFPALLLAALLAAVAIVLIALMLAKPL